MKLLRCGRNLVVTGGLLLLSISPPVFAQIERWVFVYNGPSSGYDVANSLVYGMDGNIYVAGYSWGIEGNSDFIVISLNKDTGDTNWVYRYNGPGNDADAANSIVYGADNNIYAAGYSTGNGTSTDFTVISLNEEIGDTNWVYRYNGPGNGSDAASAIIFGMDGNLYAAGSSRSLSNPYFDIIIISISSTGSERWVYRYNGTLDSMDAANAIIYGTDNNLYIAGYSNSGFEMGNFAVISVDTTGYERWAYADSIDGVANCLVYGADGNIYAAGYFSIYYDIGIMSFTAAGSKRWQYSYAGPPGSSGDDLDEAHSIVYGIDGNVYAAGVSDSTDWTEPTPAFTVISLIPAGTERWVYRYYSGAALARSIVCGADSNLYAAGYCWQGPRAFAVISLTSIGGERWIYQYNSPNPAEATSVVYGADGNVYAAGYTGGDLLVVSLDPETGIKEYSPPRTWSGLNLSIGTLQCKKADFSLYLAKPMTIQISLYNVIGEKVLSWMISAPEGTSHYSRDLSSLSTGIYILRIATNKKEWNESRKIIYMK